MTQNTYANSSMPSEWRRMDFGKPPQSPPSQPPHTTSWPGELPAEPDGGSGGGAMPMLPSQPPAMGHLPGESHPKQLQMESGLDLDALDGPFTNAEVAKASLKGLLMRNLGFYIVAGFLVGTQAPVSWEGILYSVGNDYIVIYQPDVDRYITGDLYSLKFVEFHNTKNMTPWACYRRREAYNGW